MTTSMQQLLRSILHLGSGELLGRLCSIIIIIVLGHRYGVVIVGIYTLAMTVSFYLQPVIDFGLRHVGARLIAQYPQSADEIVRRVQRRRLLMAVAALPLTLLYASLARVPLDMKVVLFMFSATGTMYALSLEWAAWGWEQLQLVGLARAAVPVCILVAIAVGRAGGARVLWWAAAGSAVGFLLQATVLRSWWKRHRPSGSGAIENLNEVSELLAWRHTSIMGVAWIANMAFRSIDMLMLGVMSNTVQVGLYSAAYRLLNQVLVTY